MCVMCVCVCGDVYPTRFNNSRSSSLRRLERPPNACVKVSSAFLSFVALSKPHVELHYFCSRVLANSVLIIITHFCQRAGLLSGV